MDKPIKLLAVAGATGSGKTGFGIELAKSLNGEIISCDSMQIYRHMNIGTAKPTVSEMQGIPHHMMNILEPSEGFSVSDFAARARDCITDISSRGKLPILVGGTGLYMDSVMGGVNFAPSEVDVEYRESLNQLAAERGNLYLHNILTEHDPESAEKIHPNNVRRVVRALEILHSTGLTKSKQDKIAKPQNSPYKSIIFSIDMPRDELYRRINTRVDIMLGAGFVDEVRALIDMGVSLDTTAMQAIGYKEVAGYLNGDCTLEFAVEKMKQESRRYAKRQLTWFSANNKINRVMLQECNRNFTFIVKFIENVLLCGKNVLQ